MTHRFRFIYDCIFCMHTSHSNIEKKVHEINIDQLIWVSCVHEISHNKSNHQAHILHLMVRVCIFLLLPGGLPPQKKGAHKYL